MAHCDEISKNEVKEIHILQKTLHLWKTMQEAGFIIKINSLNWYFLDISGHLFGAITTEVLSLKRQ